MTNKWWSTFIVVQYKTNTQYYWNYRSHTWWTSKKKKEKRSWLSSMAQIPSKLLDYVNLPNLKAKLEGWRQWCQLPIVTIIGQVEVRVPWFGNGDLDFARPQPQQKIRLCPCLNVVGFIASYKREREIMLIAVKCRFYRLWLWNKGAMNAITGKSPT
jgi:hypothetical protein